MKSKNPKPKLVSFDSFLKNLNGIWFDSISSDSNSEKKDNQFKRLFKI